MKQMKKMKKEVVPAVRRKMNKEGVGNRKVFINFFILIFSLFILIGCPNIFSPPVIYYPPVNYSDANGASVRIFVGENNMTARTIQPAQDAVAGYVLSFTGGTHDPVEITNGNYTDVFLVNGEWMITATAYRIGGSLENPSDAVAKGSITITISDGSVEGEVPAIILSPLEGGTGTLRYSINLESGSVGVITLWYINGQNVVNSFGSNNNGEITFFTTLNGDFNFAAGRYIVEVRLTNSQEKIAFRREVVEIWQGTVSFFQ